MYLITGSNGQLGHELTARIPGAIATDADTLDITDFDAVQNFVRANNIDTIINCAAYTAVDRAESDVDTATRVNVTGPENLAKTGCKLVHISTDYVFDGTAHIPYKTTDEPNPTSIYGKTKLAGERAVLKNNNTAIIIRTAWLYSPNGNNFVKTMLRLGTERESVNVVCDQIGTPTYAGDLADAILKILPQISTETAGIYHYTNAGVCSWYDFATAIMQCGGRNCHVNAIPTSEYPTAATRPYYSVLDKEKIKKTFNLEIPHWYDGLRRCMEKMPK